MNTDNEIEAACAPLHAEIARLKGRKCMAEASADPPRDCDAPYCGCNPAWDHCMSMLLDIGWVDPRTNDAAKKRCAELEALVREVMTWETREHHNAPSVKVATDGWINRAESLLDHTEKQS